MLQGTFHLGDTDKRQMDRAAGIKTSSEFESQELQ